jgi:hypothetical protein
MFIKTFLILIFSSSLWASENSHWALGDYCKILERASLALNEPVNTKHNSQDVEKISNYAHLLKSVAPKCKEAQVLDVGQGLQIKYKKGFSVTTDIFNFQKNGDVVSWSRLNQDGSENTINF